MNNIVAFILKLFFLSLVLSFLIKYGGDLLPITSETPVHIYAIFSILLPSLILAIALPLSSQFNPHHD